MTLPVGPYVFDGLLWQAEHLVLPWMATRIPGKPHPRPIPCCVGDGREMVRIADLALTVDGHAISIPSFESRPKSVCIAR